MTYNNKIVLGSDENGNFYNADGYQHILLLAPHGSGKGVAFVLPTLLTLEESCIVHDIKLENYALTSNYRESIGHKIFVFNPLKSDTHRYNPFDFLSADLNSKLNEIQRIADLLLMNCTAMSRILFVNLALYLFIHNRTLTIGEITKILNHDLIKELTENIHKLNKYEYQSCFHFLSGFLTQSKRDQYKLINELKNALYLWTNPLIDYATSASDFDITSLKTCKMTLYVGVEPDDINRLQSLMSFFYNHACDRLANVVKSLGYGNENGGVTMILDDFYTIGKIEKYTLAYLGGYKVRLFLVSSDIQNIESLYGENSTQSIMSDCAFKVFFAANDYKTAKQISSLCIDKKNNRELFSWEQIMNLHENSSIVLMNKEQPKICKKLKYFDNETLKQRVDL